MIEHNKKRPTGLLTPIPRSQSRAPRHRRGVLLLVILGMLTLFLMIGTAFVVSSNQYRRANKSYAKVGEQENLQASQDGFLGEVINQIIRDTTNQNSALRFHSLLRDLYGNDGMVVPQQTTVIPTTPVVPPNNTYNCRFTFAGGSQAITGGQILEFTLGNNYQDLVGRLWSAIGSTPTSKPFATAQNGLNGMIITFLDRNAKGYSTRIVGYIPGIPANTGGTVRILNFPAENGQPITTQAFLDRMAGSRILINGRPFNGTGVGYNPLAAANDPKLNAIEVVQASGGPLNVPIALAPNASNFLPVPGTNVPEAYFSTQWATLTPVQRQTLVNNMAYEGQGGSDESYDAADFQNMYLAWTSPQPQETVLQNIADPNPVSLGTMVLPSFHRPELVNYWQAQLASGSTPLQMNPQVLRKILLRPNWFDHPNFSGSNPEFDQVVQGFDPTSPNPTQALNLVRRMVYGPWDVDNDMDGVRDSVWVDFGAPVMVGASGKLVKPMAAIMVLDMDGRLNVNAHGTRELAGIGAPPTAVTMAGSVASTQVPRGQAYGPAEISLSYLLGNNSVQRLMSGQVRDYNGDSVSDEIVAGRYGRPETVDDEPGQDDAFDLGSQLKMQGFPGTSPLVRSNFGTLPDLRARYAFGLNDFGQPITDFEGAAANFERLTSDNPYELDLSATGPRGNALTRNIVVGPDTRVQGQTDMPYSPAELERLLRMFDIDAGTLPPRLLSLLADGRPGSLNPSDPNYNQQVANFVNEYKSWRTLLTTDSYDLPEPGFQLPEWVNNGPDGVAGAMTNPTNSAGHDDYAYVMGRSTNPANRREPVNATFADLIEYRLLLGIYNGSAPQPLTNPQQLQLQASMRMLIAPEMLAGLKLDLNRPLGNGRDDDGNGVVDEPGELEFNDANGNGVHDAGEEAFWLINETRAGVPNSTSLTQFEAASYRDDYDRDGDPATQITDRDRGDLNGDATLSQIERVHLHNYRRQLLARHLYVLAMATVDPLPSSASATEVKLRARQLAQWAINAVDFRDPDNIMTAFEYDELPFDGWGVDGNVADTSGLDGTPGNSDDDVAAQREVIWGLEKPELLMTEALAWHDRRDQQTAREEIDPSRIAVRSDQGTTEDTGNKYDPDYDQQYRPKGAAFIELYNPNAAGAGASADTHAIRGVNFDVGTPDGNPSDYPSPMPGATGGTDLGVNLAAVAVDPNDVNRRSPVWRIQVVRNRKRSGLTYGNDLNQMLIFYDPEDRTSLPVAQRPDVDRTIYFAREGTGGVDPKFPSNAPFRGNNAPTPGNDYQSYDSTDGVEFFTDQAIRPVRPGGYMVIGGGDETAPGSNIFRSPVGLTFVNGQPAQTGKIGRRIELHAGVNLSGPDAPIRMFNSTTATIPVLDTPQYNGQYVADVAIINRVIDRTRDGVVQGPANRSFSLSEPATGYPNRIFGSLYTTANMPATGPEVEGWYVAGPGSSTPLPIDIPLDENETAVRPVDPDLKYLGTVQGYRWLYLQRLANPLLPFNPEAGQPGHDPNRPVNPYLTLDHTPANLSVFNGMWNRAIDRSQYYPPYQKPGENGDRAGELASVERGWKNNPADLVKTLYNGQRDTFRLTDYNSHSPYSTENSGKRPRENSVFPSGSDHFFNAMPDCTLGFLNRSFNNDYVADRDDVTPGKPKLNVPDQPFPWLTWNNRPFANSGELMQVPNTRSSQLLRNFSFLDNTGGANTDANLKAEVYKGPLNQPPQNFGNPFYNMFSAQFSKKDGPFGHLMNFFRTETSNNTPTGDGIVGMFRVLDLVSVTSPYVGSESWLNPATFGDVTTPVASTTDPRYGLQPPFNKISSRREPGRVNLNTITIKESGGVRAGKNVWDALWQGNTKRNGSGDAQAHNGPDDDDFFLARRGYPGIDDNTLLNPAIPTLFSNPFRSSGTGPLVPINEMKRTDLDTTLNRSFFGTAGPAAESSGDPFCSTIASQAYRNSFRNPTFRYTPVSRLSSMTTTRSNVFAIWVTIGFFEVEEAPTQAQFNTTNGLTAGQPAIDLYQRVYPDGYTFGKEAGIDTGEIQRVREFAIIDRTIPAAFEPGANHNIEETIRLRRKIE